MVWDIADGKKLVPELLKNVTALLVPSSQKQFSLSHCIIQATRPRSVTAPIWFGVAVNIDKSTGCKQLIQHFSRLGFSITPDKLYRFKQSAIEDSKSEVENHKETANGFKQWVPNNVDHKYCNFKRKGTFQGIGIICVKKKQAGSYGKVPWLKNRLPATAFADSHRIKTLSYPQLSQIRKFRFEPISAVAAKSLNSDPGITMSTWDLL